MKKSTCRPLLAALATCLASLDVQAQSAEASSESAYLSEVPIVLTVSRLAQRVDEAPAAVTVIDRQMIRDSGAWDLSEVFRLVPGMYVAYHAARFYSTDSIVSYHGLMSETMSHRMQVLVDGRSVYSPLYGGVIWNDIPVGLDDIDRIEVVRGPNAASYGANSFIGVINIITRHSADQQGARVSVATGRNREEATAQQGGRSGDLTWSISAGLRNDRGEDNEIHNPTSQSFVWTKNKFDDKKIQRLNLRGDYQINLTDTLEVQFGYNGGPRQAGEVQDVFAPNKIAHNYFTKLNWRRALEDGGELSVQYYDATESSSAPLQDANLFRPPLPADMNNGDVNARRRDLEVQHIFPAGKDTRIVWGGSVRRDTTFAPHDLGGGGIGVTVMPDLYETRAFNLTRLFGNLEWRPLSALLVNLGAMAENNSYTGTDVTPRVAANWHVVPGQTLRLSYSEATRTPSVFEKRWEEYQRLRTGNPLLPALTPERVKTYDLGYLGKYQQFDVDFRLFHENYTDLIADQRNDAANRGNLNSGSATIKGFETQVKWNITKQTRLIYGLSHAVVDSPNVDRIPYTNSVPTNNQSLMLTHSLNERWRFSLIGYQTGENHFSRTDYDVNQGRDYFIPTQRRWDARVAHNFLFGKTKGELALNVQNLANAEYYEFRHDNQVPGRVAWLSLRLEMD
ncbi:MAG: TonB-dependent receptor [Sulfuricella sp.]|nr:TonB-dependent receptor [Sulfuricella sp.]